MPKQVTKNEGPLDQRVLDFMCGISELFNKEEFSDATIRLGEVELPAHRLVLAAQSEYFARALSSKFKENETGVFQYSTGSMHAYWRCFEYIYTGQYADSPAAELAAIADDDELIKDVRVYELAQYFGIGSLKSYSVCKFKAKVRPLPDKAQFVDCVRNVYASTVNPDDKLRQATVKATGSHLDKLWDKPLQDLLREGGDFAVDLVALVRSPTPQPSKQSTRASPFINWGD